jgi:hypothetical protein
MFWAAKGHGRRHNPVECGCIPGHCQRFSTWKCLGNPLKNKCFFHRCSIDFPISIDFPMIFTQEMGNLGKWSEKLWEILEQNGGSWMFFWGKSSNSKTRVFAWCFCLVVFKGLRLDEFWGKSLISNPKRNITQTWLNINKYIKVSQLFSIIDDWWWKFHWKCSMPRKKRDELPGLPRARLDHSRPLLALEIVCRNPMWEY